MPEDATRDFGALLRDARERAGISLRTIATNTKISMQALEALERNDVSRLPGGIFVRAFVRAYAKEVGLDPEETTRRFVERFPNAAAADELDVREPVQERTVLGDEVAAGRLWRLVGWSLPLVLVIVYFGFGGRLAWVRDLARPSAPVADTQVEQAPPASNTPILTTPASQAPTDPPAAGGASPAGAAPPATSVGTEGSADALKASNPASNPLPPSPAITSDATDGRFTMTLTPRAQCWVSVRSNGAVVFSGTMKPGERQNLVVGGSVSLYLGNAGGMAVELDGKPARPFGGDGEVKTIRLTAQNLKDFLETR